MNPPKRITDPTFRYVPAAEQDLRATFRRIRREMAKEAERAKAQAAVVTQINKPKERKA